MSSWRTRRHDGKAQRNIVRCTLAKKVPEVQDLVDHYMDVSVLLED